MKNAAAVLALAAAVSCTKDTPQNSMPPANSTPAASASAHPTASGPRLAASSQAGAPGPQASQSSPPASSQAQPSGPSQQAGAASGGARPNNAPPFDFGPPHTVMRQGVCTDFPEIERWSSRRGVDPKMVRAFVLTESGFDRCAATKVCSRNAIQSGATQGCFPADLTGHSAGYTAGLDEMHDPAGSCSFQNAPNPGTPVPDWRWLNSGLMQTVEPPVSFWPANFHPGNANGPHYYVLNRSGRGNMSLHDAQSCNASFNPFNPNDSICLGTLKIERILRAANQFINAHRAELGWPASDTEKDRIFAMYVAANMYSGLWNSAMRDSSHPRCSSSVANGECWSYGYSMSRVVDGGYCSSQNGQSDTERCKNGQPRQEAPRYCYGYSDFVRYARECELPYLARPADDGARTMQAYYGMLQRCP